MTGLVSDAVRATRLALKMSFPTPWLPGSSTVGTVLTGLFVDPARAPLLDTMPFCCTPSMLA